MAALLTDAATLLSDPDWFLHHVDPLESQAIFLRTDRQRLMRTLFLDGRSSFSSGEPERIALSDLTPGPANPPRLIMHMSFCGSTHLAHLLDSSGAATTLKEPQALVDLADWQRALMEQGIDDPRFPQILRASLGTLSRRWTDAAPTVLKPSNWANNLLPDLLPLPGIRVLLITIGRRAFLRAVFRGGRDRLTFTARAASHLASATGHAALVQSAISENSDPLDQAARLALVAHEVQRRLFAAAEAQGCGTLDFAEISDDPAAALERSVSALQLPHLPDAESAVRQRSSRDSKSEGRTFSLEAQAREDEEVETHHRERFDLALAWASRAFA